MPNHSIPTYYSPTSYNARYTFSAKEKDEETGYSYFGARYYNSDLSIWLSVDPLADKYPSLSPYAYCANNPVKLVDPDGEEIIEIVNTEIFYSTTIKRTKGLEQNLSSPGKPPKHKDGIFQKIGNSLNKLDHKVMGNADNRLVEGHSDGANTASDVQFVKPYATAAVTIVPGVSQVNDIMTLTVGQDMFGNPSTTTDKIVAGASLISGCIVRIPMKAVSTGAKLINRGTTIYTIGNTYHNETKKTQK